MGESALVIMVVIDLVDSTKFFQRVGDKHASDAMRIYDRIFRGLLIKYNGIEIDKTDGALLVFETMREALAYTSEYHRLVEKHLNLQSRVGIHCGHVIMHSNSSVFVSRGAKPVEVDGIHKNIAARIMSLARGGQTFLSSRAGEYAASVRGKMVMADLGTWRMKGVQAPMRLYAISEDRSRLYRPIETDKVKLVRPPKLTPRERRVRAFRVFILWPSLVFSLYVWVHVLALLEHINYLNTDMFRRLINFKGWVIYYFNLLADHIF